MGATLDDIVTRRRRAQALRFDVSGRVESLGEANLPTSEVVVIRDVWAVLGRHLELGAFRELACTDGSEKSLFVVETPSHTLAVVEPVAHRDLDAYAVSLRAVLEAK